MLIKNVTVVTADEAFTGHVEFDQGVITKVARGATDLPGTDGLGACLLPAFWDVHTHGGYGFSFNELVDLDERTAALYLEKVCQEGVCAVLATVVTDSDEHNARFIANYERLKRLDRYNVLRGLYFEGPFISKKKKGAHDAEFMRSPSVAGLDAILVPAVKVVTVTPEADTPAVYEAIAFGAKRASVAIGHSNASAEQFLKAVAHGANRVTHLFNAMSGFQHRDPGIVNAVFASTGLYVEMIGDGMHVDPLVVRETLDLLGEKHRFLIISDSLSLKGMPDGFSMLGPVPIEKRGDFCYVKDTPTLAGSCLSYDRLIQRFWSYAKPALSTVAALSALNPARSLGISDEGRIAVGCVASFVLVDQRDFALQGVFIRGERVR